MAGTTQALALNRRSGRSVDRRTAQVAEENFHERLAAAVNQAREVVNPTEGKAFSIGPRDRIQRIHDASTDRLKEMVKKQVPRDLLKTYDEMPKGIATIFEAVGGGLLGGKDARVAVAGVAIHPWEELLREGRSSRRITATELNRTREELVTRPDVFHYLCAFAPTGWEEAARDTLSGPNFLVALADLQADAWRVYYAPDARFEGSARVFDLTTYDEKVDAIRRFVDAHAFEIVMDEMTEEVVYEHLWYPIPVIREAMEVLEREMEFVRLDASSTPYRLVRVYT